MCICYHQWMTRTTKHPKLFGLSACQQFSNRKGQTLSSNNSSKFQTHRIPLEPCIRTKIHSNLWVKICQSTIDPSLERKKNKILPWKLQYPRKYHGWKTMFLFKWSLLRWHVNFQGNINKTIPPHQKKSPEIPGTNTASPKSESFNLQSGWWNSLIHLHPSETHGRKTSWNLAETPFKPRKLIKERLFQRIFEGQTNPWHLPCIHDYFLHLIFVKEGEGGWKLGSESNILHKLTYSKIGKKMVTLSFIWRGLMRLYPPPQERGNRVTIHQVIIPWGQWTWIRVPTYSSEALNPDDLGEKLRR